jgi:hypothetical protein
MNAAMIVMQYPTVESVLEVPLAQRDEEIQALPADRSHDALANRIGEGGQLHRMTTKPIPFLKSSIHTIR